LRLTDFAAHSHSNSAWIQSLFMREMENASAIELRLGLRHSIFCVALFGKLESVPERFFGAANLTISNPIEILKLPRDFTL
jgi:hypothetical protein